MRILMVNKFYFLQGGAERYFINTRDLLRSHGHTVEIFAMQDERNLPATYAPYFVPRVDYRTASWGAKLGSVARTIWSLEAARRIERVLDDFRPDVVQIDNIYHQLSPSILEPIRKRGIPIVQRLHDYKLICPNYLLYTQDAVCTRCMNRNYFQAVRYRCLHGSLSWSLVAALEMTLHKRLQIYERSVTAFTCPSAFIQQMVAQFGITNPVHHIPNYVFLDQFPYSDQDDGYLVYFGRLSREKGLPTLLEAMKKAPQARLLMVGEGPIREQLQARAKALGLTNVEWPGHLEGAALQRVLNGARFSVLPSEWYEVFGMSVLESFAVGKPVITTRMGGIPEQIDDGQDGLLYNPGQVDELAEHIQRLWDHPEQARAMGLNGRRKVEDTYTPAVHYARLSALFESLVKQ